MEHDHVVNYINKIIPFYIRQLDTEKRYIVSNRIEKYIKIKFPEADFDQRYELTIHWIRAVVKWQKGS